MSEERGVERTPLAVRFCETDLMGIVHHGNYLQYFEVGRVAWFKNRGATFDRWEGVQLPVVEARLRYRKPARFDDDLVIETRVTELKGASVRFAYRIVRTQSGKDELLCEGDTLLACVGPTLIPRRFPDFLREAFEGQQALKSATLRAVYQGARGWWGWARWGLLLLVACGEIEPGAPSTSSEVESPEHRHEQARPGSTKDTENESYYVVRGAQDTCDKAPCSFFVHRANQEVTRCNDGVLRQECRVDEISLDAVGMRDTALELFFFKAARGEALLLGKFAQGTQASGKTSLEVSHAWVRHGTPEAGSLLFGDIQFSCPFAGDCRELYSRLNSREFDQIVQKKGEILEATYREQQQTFCVNERVLYSGRLVDPQEGLDQPLWTLSIDGIYTSALTLGCDPDQVALEAARQKFPPGVEVVWVDRASPEFQEHPWSSSNYTITATDCSYTLRSPEGSAVVTVDQKTCASTVRDPPSGGLY